MGLGLRRAIWWGLCTVFAAALLLGIGAAYQWQATRSELARQPPPGRMVDIGGYRLHLYCEGSGNPTIILDAGLGDSYLVWSEVQQRIAPTNRVCAYDRGGAGYSDPSPRARTSEHIARELHTLLRRAGITPPVVLVGWSAAGLHIRSYQSQFPAEVSGLVLVDASHEHQWEQLPASARSAIDQCFRRFRWATLRMAVGLGRLPGPGGHRLWNSPFDPATDNNLAMQMPVPADRVQYARAMGHRTPWFTETLREWYSFPASAAYVARLRRPLTIPVAVVSAGKAPSPEFAAVWDRLQQDLTTLSSRSHRIVAPASDHQGMGTRGADSVAAGVRWVLQGIARPPTGVTPGEETGPGQSQ